MDCLTDKFLMPFSAFMNVAEDGKRAVSFGG